MYSKKQKTILLVEDEALIALDEKTILEKDDYKVIAVSNGEKAIKAVEESAKIDLVLMDINLGKGMSGTEAAEKILDKHDLPLIFISSYTDSETVEKTEGITSYGYILKNTSERVLLRLIKMVLKLHDARKNEKSRAEVKAEEKVFRNLLANQVPN